MASDGVSEDKAHMAGLTIVSQLAFVLNLTPGHLNEWLCSITGHDIQPFIHEHIIKKEKMDPGK